MTKKQRIFPFTWFPPTVTPNKYPNNQSKETIGNHGENITRILNLQIQDLATKIEAIIMFAKE